MGTFLTQKFGQVAKTFTNRKRCPNKVSATNPNPLKGQVGGGPRFWGQSFNPGGDLGIGALWGERPPNL